MRLIQQLFAYGISQGLTTPEETTKPADGQGRPPVQQQQQIGHRDVSLVQQQQQQQQMGIPDAMR